MTASTIPAPPPAPESDATLSARIARLEAVRAAAERLSVLLAPWPRLSARAIAAAEDLRDALDRCR